MPVATLSLHAYGTWLPDRPQGFYHHSRGLAPSNPDLARAYRRQQREREAVLSDEVQQSLISLLIEAAEHKLLTPYGLATDRSHFHALFGWRDERPLPAVAASLRRGLTIGLKQRFPGRDRWFTHKGARTFVRDGRHFAYLRDVYLPDHPGWKWDRSRGVYR